MEKYPIVLGGNSTFDSPKANVGSAVCLYQGSAVQSKRRISNAEPQAFGEERGSRVISWFYTKVGSPSQQRRTDRIKELLVHY